MGELMKVEGGGLIGLLHGAGGGLTVPKPFERDIFLFDTTVVGTSYIDGIEELEPFLKEGDRLDLFREPDNPHDNMAIVVKNADGARLGYVPRRDNTVFSRLMDAGKLLFCRISRKVTRDGWLTLDIKIYMHE